MGDDRKETKTKWPGVRARHSAACRYRNGGTRCTCGPSGYIARVTDPRTGRKRSSGVRRTTGEAINWRSDALRSLRAGDALQATNGSFADLALELVAAMRENTVKTKSGRNYKAQSKRDIENALRVWGCRATTSRQGRSRTCAEGTSRR